MARDQSPLLPASVRLRARPYLCDPTGDWSKVPSEHHEDADLADAGLSVTVGGSPRATVRDSVHAIFDATGAGPSNTDALEDLTKLVARDLWGWRLAPAYDRAYTGIVASTPDATVGAVVWRYRAEDATTRLASEPTGGEPTRLGHADPTHDCPNCVVVYPSGATVAGGTVTLPRKQLCLERGELVEKPLDPDTFAGCCNQTIGITLAPAQPCFDPAHPFATIRSVPYLISSAVGPNGREYVSSPARSVHFGGPPGAYRVTVEVDPAACTYQSNGPLTTTITVLPPNGTAARNNQSFTVPSPPITSFCTILGLANQIGGFTPSFQHGTISVTGDGFSGSTTVAYTGSTHTSFLGATVQIPGDITASRRVTLVLTMQDLAGINYDAGPPPQVVRATGTYSYCSGLVCDSFSYYQSDQHPYVWGCYEATPANCTDCGSPTNPYTPTNPYAISQSRPPLVAAAAPVPVPAEVAVRPSVREFFRLNAEVKACPHRGPSSCGCNGVSACALGKGGSRGVTLNDCLACRRDDAVTLRGHVNGFTGYGQTTVWVAEELERLGVPTRFDPIAVDEHFLPLSDFARARLPQ